MQFIFIPATNLNIAETRRDPVRDNCPDPPVLGHLPARAHTARVARLGRHPGAGQSNIVDVDLDHRSIILT